MMVICFVGFIFFHFIYVLIFNSSNFSLNNLMNDGKYLVKNLALSAVFSYIYVFMNVVQIQPIVKEFDGKFNSKHKWLFPFLFSLSLTFLLLVFVMFMFNFFNLKNQEMPFLSYFKTKSRVMYFIYILGLFLALLSSLISCLVGVKNWFRNAVKSNIFATGISILLSMVISLIGFSSFVLIVYPIIGIINFIIFIFL